MVKEVAFGQADELSTGESPQIMPGEVAGVFAVRSGFDRVQQVLCRLELPGPDRLSGQAQRGRIVVAVGQPPVPIGVERVPVRQGDRGLKLLAMAA